MKTKLGAKERELIYEALTYAINDQIEALDANRDCHGPGADEAIAEIREFLNGASALKKRLRKEVQQTRKEAK